MLHLFQIEYSTRSNLHIFPILNYYSSQLSPTPYYKGQRASCADLPCHCWLPFQLLRAGGEHRRISVTGKNLNHRGDRV